MPTPTAADADPPDERPHLLVETVLIVFQWISLFYAVLLSFVECLPDTKLSIESYYAQ